VKLAACPNCHAQYDVAGVQEPTIGCPCGTTFPAKAPAAVDAEVRRCAACGALVGAAEPLCSYCGSEVLRQPAPTGPVCPECYARNPERSRYCTACGVAFLPQPVRTRTEPLECPLCAGSHLVSRNLGGIWVEECPMCLGLWAPGDVLDRLVERARDRRRREGPRTAEQVCIGRRSTWQTEIAYRRCPVCRGAMQRKNFGHRSGVIVDWCGSHGTWLDAHEMEDIAAFVLEGGLEREPAPGEDRSWMLPADPGRMAAIAAAERLLAEEQARASMRSRLDRLGPRGALRGIGDLFALLLK